MAEEQKNVEVPKEEVVAAPAAEPVAEPAVEAKAEETAAPAATEAATETAPEVAAEPAAAAAEDKKEEEVKPVDEGTLDHKGQGANFPKNLFPSKKFFWLGSDPVDLKAIPSFKADKAVDVAHHVAAWASETGKGLLFYSEKSDKAAPHGAIHLAEASDPVNEGSNKFHFAVKGHKHTFKAATTAERDGWVAQLKIKIAEAKELATTVTESETYKKTLESFKPAKKEEKAAATPAAEAAATEEAAAPAAAEETPAAEPAAEDKKEEPKKEEPKRRSASRKRASVFGGLFGKKEEAKAAEAPAAEAETPAADAAAETPAAETTETPAVAEAEPAGAPAEEAKPEEKKEEAPKEAKPKRQSIFGGLSFNKKKAAEPAPAVEETPATTEAVADAAPAIPPVETTEPLSTEVAAAAPVEATEAESAAAPATNGETPKKEAVKSEKRKSSLPFGLGAKKEKPTSEDEGEKVKSPSAFSKLRGTFKGKAKAEKTAEKTEDVPAVPATDAAAAEASTEAAPAAEEAPVAAVEEPVAKPVETTPAVTAAA